MSAWNPYTPRSNDLPALARIADALERIAEGIEARSDATPKSDAAGTAKARPEGSAQKQGSNTIGEME